MGKKYKNHQVSDLDIQALVDGEMTPEMRASVMNEIMKSAEALRRLDELLRQKAFMREWWKKDES
jgi:hypothetical protein